MKEVKLTLSLPRPPVKEVILWALSLVVFVFSALFLWSLAIQFIPKFSTTVTLREEINVHGIPQKVMLHVSLWEEKYDKNFTIGKDVEAILDLLEGHSEKPAVKVYLSTSEPTPYEIEHGIKNKTTYKLTYTIDAELEDLNIDWDALIKHANSVSVSYEFDDSQYRELEKMAKEKATSLLNEEADERGKMYFIFYFGKKLLSEDIECGGGSYYYPLYASETTVKAAVPPSPGEENVECYLVRTYRLFGFTFSPFE